MGVGEVVDVDVVADARAVGGGVVGAEHLQRRPAPSAAFIAIGMRLMLRSQTSPNWPSSDAPAALK